MNDTIVISNKSKLLFENNNLVIIQENIEHKIFIEDISYLYIDNNQTMLSTHLINKLSNNNVLVILCDEKHLPISYILPVYGNVLSYQRQSLQLNMSDKLKKQLWKQIIDCKIRNQETILKRFNLNFDKLNKFSLPEHEGICAKIYFQELYGDIFKRREENIINIFLNYGYSILRSMIIRNIITTGLNPSISLNHINNTNQFNLADDLIEVFRPYMDEHIYSYLNINKIDSFTKESREYLLSFTYNYYNYLGQKTEIGKIIKSYIISFVDCLSGDKRKLILPFYEK